MPYQNCYKSINTSMILRIILTVISLFLVSISSNSFIQGNIYLILPILLLFLDNLDSLSLKVIKGIDNKCTRLFNYQINDKIIDVASYIYMYYLFNNDVNILFLSLYRLLGVILFYVTKSSKWLIVFFDFVKEYMLYVYFFKDNYRYLPMAILAKIIYEYIFHTLHNKREY
jgi:hypothetical protein